MTEITNLSAGPRVFNVVTGKDKSGNPILGQEILMPGETRDMQVQDMSHPAVAGMVKSGEIGIDVAEQRKAEAAAQLAANSEVVETEVRRRVDLAVAEAMKAKDTEIARLQAEVDALTKPADGAASKSASTKG